MSSSSDVDLISIGGASRSGSTLLALLLSRVNGYFPVGELRYVWSRGYIQNQLCGCGTPFHTCAFWRAVFEEAYGGFGQVPIQEIQALHLSVAQVKRLPHLMSPSMTPLFKSRVNRYLGHLDRLCKAIYKVSGAGTLVDSSKQPAFCYLLTRLPHANVKLVQLVRDSRAVAFSQTRKKSKPDIHWSEEAMTQFPPPKSAFHWGVLNLAMEAIRATKVPCQLVRYEDLVRDPEGELDRIDSPLSTADGVPIDEEMPLPINHTVSGNPLRFEHGRLRIRPDTEWQRRMASRDRLLVTIMTLPLLTRYGYVHPGWHPPGTHFRIRKFPVTGDAEHTVGTDAATPKKVEGSRA
jgi:hypothetical protein